MSDTLHVLQYTLPRIARRHAGRMAGSIAMCVAGILFVAAPLRAQRAEDRRVRAIPQWEVRQDLTFAREPSVHAGAGLNVRAGYYVRLGATLNAGAVRGVRNVWVGTQRLDLTARFLLDPFGERARAWYGGGGVSIAQGPGVPAVTTMQWVVGLEGAQDGKMTPSVELGLGGGVRLGVVLRGTRRGQAR
jgi:hypothetical protein